MDTLAFFVLRTIRENNDGVLTFVTKSLVYEFSSDLGPVHTPYYCRSELTRIKCTSIADAKRISSDTVSEAEYNFPLQFQFGFYSVSLALLSI